MTPCVSTPLRFAQTRTSATTAASAFGMPLRAKTSVAKRLSASAGAVGAAWPPRNCVLLIPGSDPRGKVFGQPIAHEIAHQRVPLREHEMVDVGDEVEIGRISGALEKLDRLLGRRHRVVRRMKQKQGPRRDSADDLVCVER